MTETTLTGAAHHGAAPRRGFFPAGSPEPGPEVTAVRFADMPRSNHFARQAGGSWVCQIGGLLPYPRPWAEINGHYDLIDVTAEVAS